MPNITPDFGVGGLAALSKSYGDWSAQQMQETGKLIETSLQRMNTNRQIQGLGQALSQTNPESPEWPKQAVALGAQFPLAMQSEAGKMLLGTQAQAHAQWTATQRATAQFGNQVALENLRYRHTLGGIEARGLQKGNTEVDLTMPDTLAPRNPASGINLQGPTQSGEPIGAAAADEAAPLFGQNESLPDISGATISPIERAKQRFLAMGLTKVPRDKLATAVQQEEVLDRQDKKEASREEMAAKRDTEKAAAEEARAARTEATQKRLLLTSQLSSVDREVSQKRAALNKHLESKAERDDEFYARKKELEQALQDAGAEQTRVKNELNSIGKETEDVFKDEAAARAAGKKSGDIIILINPKTGKPAKARLE